LAAEQHKREAIWHIEQLRTIALKRPEFSISGLLVDIEKACRAAMQKAANHELDKSTQKRLKL
jgi:hypothetical protein